MYIEQAADRSPVLISGSNCQGEDRDIIKQFILYNLTDKLKVFIAIPKTEPPQSVLERMVITCYT